jgi:hypothetical protein
MFHREFTSTSWLRHRHTHATLRGILRRVPAGCVIDSIRHSNYR